MKSKAKLFNIILWVIQVLLAALFLIAGFMKLGMPIPKLSTIYSWTGQASSILVRALGLIDTLAGAGLILPAALQIRPRLTAWTAVAIFALMCCATILHLSRGEGSVIGFNIIVALLAAVVAWGRLK